jgi:DNA polymerase-3 subunit beta
MITRPITGLSFNERVIVPRKGLSEIRKILDEQCENEVGIDINEGFLVLETSDAKISMRLIDGEFPDYNQVLPKDKGVTATVSGEELAQALRRVVLMVTDKAKCVRFDFSKGALKIFSSSPELGDASEEIPVKYEGQALSLGFNARYLLDFAASLSESQALTIELHGELGPGRFQAGDDDSYCGIIMPMRLQ